MNEKAIIAAHEKRITRCKTCRAKIVWLKTAAGKNMPADADSVYPIDEVFDRAKHISHFATCPDAPKHRRQR